LRSPEKDIGVVSFPVRRRIRRTPKRR
jgi:hypothetical protein